MRGYLDVFSDSRELVEPSERVDWDQCAVACENAPDGAAPLGEPSAYDSDRWRHSRSAKRWPVTTGSTQAGQASEE